VDFSRFNLVGESPAFLTALHLIRKVSSSDAIVLIEGETGTGKELAARAIHYLGSRKDAPFIPVNCGAIPETLIENEFFGHARGAFTDARDARAGVIENAESGTLFLDELEALSPRGQVVLLRFLQDLVYRPVGGSHARRANVRIIGSTNADLGEMARRRAYRGDLLYRLSILTVRLPPLRNRPGDAARLASHFAQNYSALYRMPLRPFDEASRRHFAEYSWPGNVRELENAVHRAVVLSEGSMLSVPDAAAEPDAPSTPNRRNFQQAKAQAIAEFERAYVTELLRRTRGNLSMAARLCGKERSRLGKLLKKHGLERMSFAS
jgi:DNA-binding NtrC family response regulator